MLPVLHPEFETQSPLVVAFMDRCESFVEGVEGELKLRLVGWALSRAGATARPVRIVFYGCAPAEEHLDPVLRRDVAQAHGGDAALEWCGWDQEVTVPPTCFDAQNPWGRLEMLLPGDTTWTSFAYVERSSPPPAAAEEEEAPPPPLLGALRTAAPLPSVVVIDDVYADPHAVRAFALQQEFHAHPAYHRGERTEQTFLFPGIKELIERALGRRICEKDWHGMGTNGCFQWCRAGDQVVYHADVQEMAGVIFLTPDAPPECGTSLYRSRGPGHARRPAPGVFDGGFLDGTRFEQVDAVGNVFNRLVLFDAQLIHAASQYFGTDAASGRLFQMFFFNFEKYEL